MKKKNGFTLIELVVVIALIAILAVTLAPRLRDQIAKANDSKAIATLGSLRTLSEVFYADFQKTVVDYAAEQTGTPNAETTYLYPDLDNTAKTLVNAGTSSDGLTVNIGGSRPSAKGTVTYGGTIEFTFAKPTGTNAELLADNVYIWFDETSVTATGLTAGNNEFDTKGMNWASY